MSKDKVTGELISKREEKTSYYDTGEINVCIQKRFDGKGNLVSERSIKHFRDGRQPEIEVVKELIIVWPLSERVLRGEKP